MVPSVCINGAEMFRMRSGALHSMPDCCNTGHCICSHIGHGSWSQSQGLCQVRHAHLWRLLSWWPCHQVCQPVSVNYSLVETMCHSLKVQFKNRQ